MSAGRGGAGCDGAALVFLKVAFVGLLTGLLFYDDRRFSVQPRVQPAPGRSLRLSGDPLLLAREASRCYELWRDRRNAPVPPCYDRIVRESHRGAEGASRTVTDRPVGERPDGAPTTCYAPLLARGWHHDRTSSAESVDDHWDQGRICGHSSRRVRDDERPVHGLFAA